MAPLPPWLCLCACERGKDVLPNLYEREAIAVKAI